MNLRPYSHDMRKEVNIHYRRVPRLFSENKANAHSAFRCPFGWLGSSIMRLRTDNAAIPNTDNKVVCFTQGEKPRWANFQIGPSSWIWKPEQCLSHRLIARTTWNGAEHGDTPDPSNCCHQNNTSSTPTRPSNRVQKCTNGRPSKDSGAPNKGKIDKVWSYDTIWPDDY